MSSRDRKHFRHAIPRLSRRVLSGRPPLNPEAESTASKAEDPICRTIDAIAYSIVDDALVSANALEADPMLGEYSTIASLFRSIVTRSGQAIPDVIAVALRENPHYLVLREHQLPLTRAADEIVRNNDHTTPDVEVRADTHVLNFFATDLIVIDRNTRHATLIECVRGSVPLSGPRTKALLRTLRTAALSARSALEADGHRINAVTCTVFDRYGRAGHDESMTMHAGEIDAFLEVPVIHLLDRLDRSIRDRLAAIVEPAPHESHTSSEDPKRESRLVDHNEDVAQLPDHEVKPPKGRNIQNPRVIYLSRSIGPAEWRRMMGRSPDQNDRHPELSH
ncbi:MAG: hypothetical protein KAG89_21940 [Fulvimarina manganoxydans]|uniref:hypothetical protein n=1 Tax=Fulvimarina manganoxydans TaxID=937218 RepID=UPI002352756C|nr:hypothetical protein [Fulvimarina manganoxydans]MCK5934808.1 hypothetical protein [Fulvimarina manganoxydans]